MLFNHSPLKSVQTPRANPKAQQQDRIWLYALHITPVVYNLLALYKAARYFTDAGNQTSELNRHVRIALRGHWQHCIFFYSEKQISREVEMDMKKKEPCEPQLGGRKRHSCISERNKRLVFNAQHQKNSVFCGDKRRFRRKRLDSLVYSHLCH